MNGRKNICCCAHIVGGNETKEKKKKLIKSECELKQWRKKYKKKLFKNYNIGNKTVYSSPFLLYLKAYNISFSSFYPNIFLSQRKSKSTEIEEEKLANHFSYYSFKRIFHLFIRLKK